MPSHASTETIMGAAVKAWLADAEWHTAGEIAAVAGVSPSAAGRILSRLHFPERRLDRRTGRRSTPDRDYPGRAPDKSRQVDEYAPTSKELRAIIQAASAALGDLLGHFDADGSLLTDFEPGDPHVNAAASAFQRARGERS